MKRKSKAILVCVIVLIIIAIAAFLLVPQIKKQLYPREYCEFVEKYSAEYSIPEPLLYAIIKCESSFNPKAESRVGARGLMQLMPETYQWISSNLLDEDFPTGEIIDPETNIKYGSRYLKYLYDRFENWETSIAAYNAGQGRVAGWLKDSRYSDDGITLKAIPNEETNNYVNRVFNNYEQYNKIYYNGEN